MAIKTIRVFAEYTSDGYVPMPSQGNIDYGVTVGSTFPETQPSSFQTDDPNIDVAVTTMTDFYVWIRTHGSAWNPSYTRVVRVYPDSPSINSVVMNMIVAVGGGGTTISSGGGVSYYLNGGTSQGVLDGSTYYEMNKVPVQGSGVDFFKINTTGFQNIAQFVTDAGDPGLLNIPAGNWPLGFYMSASDNSGAPKFYAEIYKYSAAGVFTLLGSSVATPEVISNGQAIDYYTSNVAIPDTTLLVTDRIAIRIFVDTDGNRTINLHTQDSHLSTVGTTFTRGLTAINGLIKQVQFLAIGNAGSDAAIVSSDDTHTINLPTASATKRGLLNSTDWATFNAKQPALSGDGFVKISGSTISYDNSSYQPLDGDLTAIGALAGTSGILKKTGANTWALDTTVYLSTTDAASTYQRLDKMVSNLLASDTEYPNSNAVLAALALKANAENPSFTGYMTIGGAYPKIYLTDSDNNPDYFIGNDDGYFRIYDQTNSLSRFYITNVGVSTFPGDVIVGTIAKSGGTASQFLKADGTVDSTAYATSASLADYLTSATAATTYQRIDKMVSNLLASDTEYPNSNAVLAKLALKADAANPSFTGSMNISGAESRVNFYDENAARKYFIGYDGGFLRIYQDAGSTSRFYINSSGKTFIPGTLEVGTIIKTNGLATEFLKADGTVDSNTYALNSALANYLLSATAGTTYQTLANLSTDLTASTTKYPSVTAVNDGLATKQPLDADLTAIAALTGTSGLLKKTAADTWTLDTAAYITSSALTNYLLSADAATTYQRKDKMVSNLLASDTEYPNSNAVIAALALKANAANPTFTGDFTISGATPRLYFVDTDNNPDYTLFTDSGYFYIYDQTAGATKFQITPSGNAINTGTLTSASFIKSGGTSSQFLMADGSVSTGIANTITGSLNTGYIPKATGANTLGNSIIYTDGTKIGINTNTPSSIFEINAGDTTIATYSYGLDNKLAAGGSFARANRIYNTNYTAGTSFFGILGGASSLNYAYWTVGNPASIDYTGYNTQSGIFLFPSSNVGIGTSSDSGYKLDVNGLGRFSGSLKLSSGGTLNIVPTSYGSNGSVSFRNIADTATRWNIYNYTGGGTTYGSLNFSDGSGTDRFIINEGGASTFSSGLTVNGQITMAYSGNPRLLLRDIDSGAGNVGILFRENTTDQWSLASAAGNIIFYSEVNASTRLKLMANGNTLIGTDTDSGYKLDVTGTGRFTSALYVSNTNGTGVVNAYSGTSVGTYIAKSQSATANFVTTGVSYPRGLGYGAIVGAGNTTDIPVNNSAWNGGYGGNIGFWSDIHYGVEGGTNSVGYNAVIRGSGDSASFGFFADLSGAVGGTRYGIYTKGEAKNYFSGSVGIGTTSPTFATLQVVKAGAGQGDTNGVIMARASDGDQNWVSIGNFSTTGSSYGWIQASSLAAYKNLILNPSGGNVLIGTTTDSGYKLNVSGSLNIGQDQFLRGGGYKMAYRSSVTNFTYSGTTSWQVNNDADNVALLIIANSGAATFASSVTALRYQANSSSASLVGYGVGTGLGMFNAGTDILGFASASTERMRLTSDGALIVGATSMTYTNSTQGYVAGFRGAITSQAYVSIATSNHTLSSQGLIIGYDTSYARFHVRQGIGISFGTSDIGERVVIGGNGNVMIGTATDSGYKFDVSGTGRFSGSITSTGFNLLTGARTFKSYLYGTDLTVNTSGGWAQSHRIYNEANTAQTWFFGAIGTTAYIKFGNPASIDQTGYNGVGFELSSSGSGTYAGSVTATAFYESSDSRLKVLQKDDIQIEGIENLKAKLYTKNGKLEYGYFAQEAQSYMPSAVNTNEDGYLNLSYREVHTVKIARLEREVEQLKKQLNVA